MRDEQRSRRLSEALRRGPPAHDPLEVEWTRQAAAARFFGSGHGPVIAGRYQIVRRIGAGGMGTVFLAHDVLLDRRVAIKLPHAHAAGARQLDEARALARLAHPHVLRIFEVGSIGEVGSLGEAGSAQPRPYLVLEYVEGMTLEAWLTHAPRSDRDIVRVFLAVAAGLGAAHREGLVHRDVKPSNVLIAPGDAPELPRGVARVLLCDFGLARHGTAGAEGRVGTALYMAPEQRAGAAVDARADQFSLCVALYEALYHRSPFASRALGRASLVHGADRLEFLPGVGRELASVLRRGLALDPAERYPTMEDLARALRGCVHPRRRLPPLLLGLAVSAVGVLTRAAAPAPPPTCDAVASPLSGTWNEDTRRALHEAFVRDPQHPPALTSIPLQQLDAHVAAWTRASVRSCEAPQHPHAAARSACLERQRLDLAALLDLLVADARPGMFHRTWEAISRLEPPQRCLDATDDALDDERPRADARSVNARAHFEAGRWEDALQLAHAGERQARVEGDARLVEHLRGLQTSIMSALGREPEVVLQRARERHWSAAARGDAPEAVFGAVEVLRAGTASQRLSGPASRAWEQQVHAWLHRTPPNAPIRADALLELAIQRRAALDYAGAEALLQQALATCRAQGRRSSCAAASLDGLAGLARIRGETRQAVQLQREALRALEDEVGPAFPRTSMVMSNLGRALLSDGQIEAALEVTLEARRRLAVAFVGDAHQLVQVTTAIGFAYTEHGAHDEAYEALSEALALARRHQGERHPETLFVQTAAGAAAREAGDLRQARVLLSGAEALARALEGAESFEVAHALYERALLEERAGQLEDALTLARDCEALTRRLFPDETYRPQEAAEAIARLEAALAEVKR